MTSMDDLEKILRDATPVLAQVLSDYSTEPESVISLQNGSELATRTIISLAGERYVISLTIAPAEKHRYGT